MMFDPVMIVELLALGCFTGFLAGLLGIGGGLMMVPIMTWLLAQRGIPVEHVLRTAIGTSLATICFTSISSVRAHHKRGAVRWPIVQMLVPGILLGAYLGSWIATQISGTLLSILFAGFLFFSAWQALRGKKAQSLESSETRLLSKPGMVGAGGVIGTLSGLLGAGGGFISIPFMTWRGVPIHNAVATSAALGFPIAVAGTIGYIANGWNVTGMPPGALGFVFLPALAVLAIASMTMAPLGAKTAHSMNTAALKKAFACLQIVLGTYMTVRVFMH